MSLSRSKPHEITNRGRPKTKIHDPPPKTEQNKTKGGGKKNAVLEYSRSDPAPPPEKAAAIRSCSKHTRYFEVYHKAVTPRLLTVYKKLSDSYCRGLEIVRHYDPVQSARPRSSPRGMVGNTAKVEFLQHSRPLDTVIVLFEDDAKQLQTNLDVPPNQATPPPALCCRTCRRTPCYQRRQRSSNIQ